MGNLAERRVVLGSAQRQELAGDAGIVAVELAEEGQPGVVVDVPGQARGDVVALVVDMVDLGVAVAHHAGDAIEKASLVVERAGAVEADLLVVVVADLGLHLVTGDVLRTQADHVEHAAGRGLAVDRGGRAAQQGDTLQVPGFQLRVVVDADRHRQAVEELGRLEAAHLQPVGTGVAAETAGDDAGHVAHRVVEVVHGAVGHLLAGRHRDRARGLEDRRIGLGAGHAALGHVAAGRPQWVFLGAADRHRLQRQGVFRHLAQAVGAAGIFHQFQAAALERFAQCAGRVEATLHGVGAASFGERRVQGEDQAGLGRDAVQGACQRPGGDAVVAHAGLFGRGGVEERCGNGEGDG